MDAVTGNKSTVTSKAFENPVNARYVRLLITKPASGNKAARIHELELREEAPFAFYEKQDILNAEIQTSQELAEVPTEMKTWISDSKNIMVTELTSNGTQDANFQVGVWAENNDRANKPITAENDESSVTVTRATQNTAPDDTNAHVSQAAISTKIIGADGVAAASDENIGKVLLSLHWVQANVSILFRRLAAVEEPIITMAAYGLTQNRFRMLKDYLPVWRMHL